MEVGENKEYEVCGWCMENRPNSRGPITPCHSNYKNAILSLRITKKSFCRSELQKCHSITQNYKNATPGPLMLAHSLK